MALSGHGIGEHSQVMSEKSGSAVGKWLAGIAASIIAALGMWWLTSPGGPLNPEDPEVEAPHAPAITAAGDLYDEQITSDVVAAGQTRSYPVAELWSAPEGLVPDCATASLAFTWIVRSPYPDGGDELQIQHLVPRGGGRTETIAEGSSGESTIGFCDELILFNPDVTDYQVEIRHASTIVG
jgi:hypothetical protein